MNLKLAFNNSRFQVAALLTLAWIVYLIAYYDAPEVIITPLVIIAFGFLVDLILRRFIRSQHTHYSSLITTLLIALIISPDEAWYVGIIAVTLALLSKYIIRTWRHWFNPAAFGIFFSTIFFDVSPGWWVTAGSRIATVILVIGMIYVLYRLKRLWIPITFLMVFYLRSFFLPRGIDLDVFLDGTIILFAFVMMTDPITSPISGKWKYGYGLVIGLILMTLDSLNWSLSFDPLLASLLITNLIVIVLLKFTQILSKSKNLESSN